MENLRSSWRFLTSLNESPSEKEGKSLEMFLRDSSCVLPLNESPSEKEGKSRVFACLGG